MITDCLIVGYNDENFQDHVAMLRSMGTKHPNYRDLDLNFIEFEGKAYRAMDILDHFYYEGRQDPSPRKFHNAEVLWMVIMYLGTYLSKRGFTFDFVNLFQLDKEELKEKLLTRQYRTVLITTTIYNYDSPIIEAVNFVRELNSEAEIIVGGPYMAKRSETMDEADLKAMFKYLGADFYVRSREGEQALVRILEAIKSDRNFAAIPNIAYAEDDGHVLTRTEVEINSLQDNMIDYSLFPKEKIGDYVNLRITKGCPFRCAFCSFPLRTDKYNVSQVDAIEQELNAIRDVGTVTGLFFTDDTVNVPLATFKDMLRMMIRQNYGFKWHCFFRADFCDEEVVDLMARSGCQGVFFGLESANDQLLQNMHKTPRKIHYQKAIPLFKAAGIQVFASLFFGFPGETYETAQETIDFLEEMKPDFYRALVWYCDPVTPIWDERDRYGLKGYSFSWSHDTMTVDEACSIVERSFLTFDTPSWVPDPGFNFVSLYLLQNRGMSFEQIKTFLKCFDAVVREKIVDPNRAEPSPDLMQALRLACQFDRAEKPDLSAVERYSAERYVAAERYWTRQFAGSSDPHARQEDSLSGEAWRLAQPHAVTSDLQVEVEGACSAGPTGVFVAAYAAALLRLRARDDLTILIADDDLCAVPIRLLPAPETSFRELAQAVEARIGEAKQHRLFWPRILSSVLTMPPYARSRPEPDLAFLAGPGTGGVEERLRFTEPAYRSLQLILRAKPGDSATGLQFMHAASRERSGAVDALGRAVIAVLRAAAANPGVRIGDIEVEEPTRQRTAAALPAHADLDFNF